MKGLDRVIRELADNDVPVLLIGEGGTGKKATAERIHLLSARREHAFEILSCAQLSLEQFQGELLGRPGTLFLEEIGDLNRECQEQLLALIPVAESNGNGASKARLIFGTARDLELDVRSGRFREDLYYRISAVSLRLPPLRQRREDIPQLLSFFMAKYASEFHCEVPTLSEETQRLFVDYSWPGNLRELEDAAKAIAVLGDEALAMGGLRSLLAKSERGNGHRLSLKEAAKAASREAEKELILKVLARTRWNRRRAAQELQISYKALLYKLKQIGFGELEGAS